MTVRGHSRRSHAALPTDQGVANFVAVSLRALGWNMFMQ